MSDQNGWRPIVDAPTDGRLALVLRPLADNSGDAIVAIKRLIGGNNHCWDTTVPTGHAPVNPTDGSCHVTHWQPLPPPPAPQDQPKTYEGPLRRAHAEWKADASAPPASPTEEMLNDGIIAWAKHSHTNERTLCQAIYTAMRAAEPRE